MLARKMGLGNAEQIMEELLAKTPAVIEQVQRGLPRGVPARILERVLQGLRKSAAVFRT